MWDNEKPGTISLKKQILNTLHKTSWQAVDVLRIGFEEDGPECPVVVWITMTPGRTPVMSAIEIADRCQVILTSHGFPDVHCELKEGTVVRHSMQRLTHGNPGTDRDYKWNRCDVLGTTIAAEDAPYREGTKGLYLRVKSTHEGQSRDEPYALTCRHVLFNENDNHDYLPHSSRSIPHGSLHAIQPGTSASVTLEKLEQRLENTTNRIMKLENSYNLTEEKKQKQLDEQRQVLASTNYLLPEWQALQASKSRRFGSIAYARSLAIRSPEGVQHPFSKGFLSDWALVALDPAEHQHPIKSLRNHVFWTKQMPDELQSKQVGATLAQVDSTGCIALRGTIPISDIQKPPFENEQLGKNELIVAKRGRSTHLTYGSYNQIRSVLRYPSPAVGEMYSEEWLVMGHRTLVGDFNAKGAFSDYGDSGSVVWDLTGRIGGILSAGLKDKHNIAKQDTSYVTHIDSILMDMKECGLVASVL
ncbi:hypothetical protein K4K54_002565 [Colletotrichum sp. SAR 10_86]|nr:hypothetical protein K4K51_010578 [Colletotrichum sp. SAR 10_75]KAI8212994.1 hypothetical protein K4K52_006585 [Colletotrichum sp. SAR 10_76]KAI8229449.1 hypothetical protein K4K53_005575 [Colletotrichum sp. SAR 10_77]KAI8236681.1 hypothetical protein K4K54_002565 [Colletotrichum sp. SAR 10_86]KAJ5006538.1 hypothetical protein K4K48_003098 [Colletotrichum sp. SAR 10_66]